MTKCTDTDLGALLHAYELNVQSETEAEHFEIHLLECDYCFKQLKGFEQVAALLSRDDEIIRLTSDAAREEYPGPETFLRKLWRYIWPETPALFKPALAYLLVFLMVFPAYWGVGKMMENEIRSVQTVNLVPGRSAGESVFMTSTGDDGLLSFVFRGATTGESYLVLIQSEEGRVLFRNDAFDSFDEYETGWLLLPLSKIKPGSYQLVIIDSRAEPPLDRQEYSFRIEK